MLSYQLFYSIIYNLEAEIGWKNLVQELQKFQTGCGGQVVTFGDYIVQKIIIEK